MIRKGEALPSVLFNTRVRDESIEGPNPYRWDLKSSGDYFEGKRVILFGAARRIHADVFHLSTTNIRETLPRV